MNTLKKGDFIEIEFTAKVKDGEVFDSNIKEDLEKANLLNTQNKDQLKPFIFSLGQGMFLSAIDEHLIGKEPNKKYSIELSPEKAFGKRSSRLVRLLPLKMFLEKNVRPQQGMSLNFDGQIGKIISVSGGRVIVDFNNPLAGKEVIYEVSVKRKIDETKEKVDSLSEFFLSNRLKFETDYNKKEIIILADKSISKFIENLSKIFEELVGFKLILKELENKK